MDEWTACKSGVGGVSEVICLSVTCRPNWRPWLEHQLAKQEHPHELIVFDDCVKPTWTVAVRPERRLQMTLGEKRQALLDIMPKGEPFCWWDDDDWFPKERIYIGQELLKEPAIDIIGYGEGIFVDVKTLQTRRLDAGERVTFNGAIFSPRAALTKFQPMNRGEDTMWLQGVLKDATVVSYPNMQHAWMSHEGNVSGKRGSMSFEGPKFQRFDSWELKFLATL